MGANTRSKRSCSHNPPVDIISIPKEPPVHIISINNDWTINHLSRQRDRDGAKATKVKNDISKYRTRWQRRHDPREYNNNNNLLMEIGASSALSLLKAAFLSLCLLLAYSCTNHIRSLKIKYGMSSGINTPTTSNTKNKVVLHIPSGLDYGRRRSLSLNLGEGKCLWQPPVEVIPTTIDFHKTIVVGFPSGDKRLTYMQMEALTGWPARDEWEFDYLGTDSYNHPFIKANYPHHDGIWGWGTIADQVVLVVGNVRKSMVEYHDILWDLGYATTSEQARSNRDKLYIERPPLEDFYEWRDRRVLDEIHWYGWFIDWWMEGGLLRDIFTHKITTVEHYNMLMHPYNYSLDELDYNNAVGPDTVVEPSYHSHCTNGDISGGCKPVAVISVDKLLDQTEGPDETAAIANALMTSPKMSPYVIDPEAWNCLWEELILNRKGALTVQDRPNPYSAQEYGFSAEMLQAMRSELDRLIVKYSSSEWSTLSTANRLVELLTWHRDVIQVEEDELYSDRRVLTTKDFLGPKEREKIRLARRGSSKDDVLKKPNMRYFDERASERMIEKRRNARKAQRMNARREGREQV